MQHFVKISVIVLLVRFNSKSALDKIKNGFT